MSRRRPPVSGSLTVTVSAAVSVNRTLLVFRRPRCSAYAVAVDADIGCVRRRGQHEDTATSTTNRRTIEPQASGRSSSAGIVHLRLAAPRASELRGYGSRPPREDPGLGLVTGEQRDTVRKSSSTDRPPENRRRGSARPRSAARARRARAGRPAPSPACTRRAAPPRPARRRRAPSPSAARRHHRLVGAANRPASHGTSKRREISTASGGTARRRGRAAGRSPRRGGPRPDQHGVGDRAQRQQHLEVGVAAERARRAVDRGPPVQGRDEVEQDIRPRVAARPAKSASASIRRP